MLIVPLICFFNKIIPFSFLYLESAFFIIISCYWISVFVQLVLWQHNCLVFFYWLYVSGSLVNQVQCCCFRLPWISLELRTVFFRYCPWKLAYMHNNRSSMGCVCSKVYCPFYFMA